MYTLITGGSAGIGKALAKECAQRGMDLLLVALPGNELEETAQELREQFQVTVHTFAVDLVELEGPKKVFDWCVENNFTVNILINNAGVAGTAVFSESHPSYSDLRIMVNVRALTLLTHYFLPSMKLLPQAYILNVGSMAAFYAIPYKTVYSASKAYVLQFSRALKSEVNGAPVSISVVCPNGVETNQGTYGRIKSHGWKGRITKIPVDDLARLSIDQMLRKKTVIIPRLANRLILVISKMMHPSLVQRTVSREFKKEVHVS